MLIFVVMAIAAIAIFCFMNYEFKQTTYCKMTHNTFLATKLDLGRNGEYLTFKHLRRYEKTGGKFLFNCYLPNENGETTEIDVMLVCEDGIFVFESKNYSGWIFGSENSKTWTQSLPQGRGRSHKEHFLNPIMQNNLHIKWLKKMVGEEIPIHSVIVFSERCTLKKVSVTSSDIFLINRDHTLSTVIKIRNSQKTKISADIVTKIYSQLYPLTQVSEELKLEHIANIKEKEQKKVVEIKPIVAMNVESRKCPNCGGELLLRTAKKGKNAGNKFWGCSNYPKCKYVKMSNNN